MTTNMQIGGVGSGHSSSAHHVTNCIHEHKSTMKDAGPMGGRSFGGGSNAVSGQASQVGQSFSLSAWLADPIGKVKKMFGRVWNGRNDSGDGSSAKTLSGNERVMAELAEDLLESSSASGSALHGGTTGQPGHQQPQTTPDTIHNPQIAAAATAVKSPDMMQGNPYFSTVENASTQRQTLWQKMKVRLESAAGFLTKKFSFSSRNSFQAKQEQSKEDLRKRSRYRGDNLDVECVLTDDSYLLDSYDRRGEYSQLSTKK